VVAVLLGGGAFAVYKFDPFNAFSTGPAAAEAVPSDALFYIGVDLDPSAEQKVRAVQFLNHFPAFKENVDVADAESDIRKSLFDTALASSDCELSFDDDVKPWLGYKFALAGMPGDDAESPSAPNVLLAIEVTDENGAKEGLDKLDSCGGGDSDFGLAFSGDYAILPRPSPLRTSMPTTWRRARSQTTKTSSPTSTPWETSGSPPCGLTSRTQWHSSLLRRWRQATSTSC